MRVSAEAKEATRQEILNAAQGLFTSQGFEATTTRDISRRAGIAAGTLFNYFPTKEAIVGCLAYEALQRAQDQFEREHKDQEDAASLEEAMFGYAAIGLRKLKPLRRYLASALDAVFSPAVTGASSDYREAIRSMHLETVGGLVAKYGLADALSAHTLQLYWTLYVGVLAHWTSDRSPKQEDTLALLDESIDMFVIWLTQ